MVDKNKCTSIVFCNLLTKMVQEPYSPQQVPSVKASICAVNTLVSTRHACSGYYDKAKTREGHKRPCKS